MLPVEILLQSKSIISSGTIALGKGENLFTIKVVGVNVDFLFEFADPEPDLLVEALGMTARVHLRGFDSPLGIAISLPDLIQTPDTRISVNMVIHTIAGQDGQQGESPPRLVSYTIFSR